MLRHASHENADNLLSSPQSPKVYRLDRETRHSEETSFSLTARLENRTIWIVRHEDRAICYFGIPMMRRQLWNVPGDIPQLRGALVFLFIFENHIWPLSVLRCPVAGGNFGVIDFVCRTLKVPAQQYSEGDLEAWPAAWLALAKKVETWWMRPTETASRQLMMPCNALPITIGGRKRSWILRVLAWNWTVVSILTHSEHQGSCPRFRWSFWRYRSRSRAYPHTMCRLWRGGRHASAHLKWKQL